MRLIAGVVTAVCAMVAAGCSHRVASDRGFADASAMGMTAIDSLVRDLRRDTTQTIKGLVVARHGRVVAESYFNGDGPDTLHDIRSATKSITALLMGIAVDRGAIRSVDTPLDSVVPALAGSPAGATPIRDYLTMRSGLDDDDQDSLSTGNENRLDASADWLAFASHVPRKWPAGDRYVYSSLNAYLTGAAVEAATHVPLSDFAGRNLFQPLGIGAFVWRRGPRGEGVGEGNLRLTARNLVAIGELVLHGGAYHGARVVSERWVATMVSAIVPTGGAIDPYADAYGYMWYSKRYLIGADTVDLHFASGNGGNKIYVVPRYDMVIAITSSAYNTRYGQRRSEQILLRVLRALGGMRRGQ
jgi:CubicO group peptidase (beta-lactamase class C family)